MDVVMAKKNIFGVCVLFLLASQPSWADQSTANANSNQNTAQVSSFDESWANFKEGMGQFGHSLNRSLVQTKQAFADNFSSSDTNDEQSKTNSSKQ